MKSYFRTPHKRQTDVDISSVLFVFTTGTTSADTLPRAMSGTARMTMSARRAASRVSVSSRPSAAIRSRSHMPVRGDVGEHQSLLSN